MALALAAGVAEQHASAQDRLGSLPGTTAVAYSVAAVAKTGELIPLANVETVFEVKGMHCPACPLTVKIAAKAVRGVIEVRVSREQERAWVTYDPSQTTPDAIAAAISKAGYPAKPLAPETPPKGS